MHKKYTSSQNDHHDLHMQLREKKCLLLDEMWNFTQNYLDQNLKDCMECMDELEVIEEMENSEEFRSILKKLDSVKEEINALYINYLEKICKSNLKKEKIILLKENFGDEISTSEIVNAVGCSKSYARSFYLLDGKVQEKDKRNHLSKKTRDHVLIRDNNSCVACGHTEMLEIHHIMPVMGSSIKELDHSSNLVTLCAHCHYLAHSSNIMYRYMTKIIKDKLTHNTLDPILNFKKPKTSNTAK